MAIRCSYATEICIGYKIILRVKLFFETPAAKSLSNFSITCYLVPDNSIVYIQHKENQLVANNWYIFQYKNVFNS